VTAVVLGWALGDGIEALVVAIDGHTRRPDGSTYHITYSYASNHHPAESNELLRRRIWRTIGPYPVEVTPFCEQDPITDEP
jgi:hypothetical protein